MALEWTVTAEEIAEKERRIRVFLTERNRRGILFSHKHHFAWATGGRENYVAKGAEGGVGHALFTAEGKKYLLCDNIEEPRLRNEEQLEAQGFEFVTEPWWNFDVVATAERLCGGAWSADKDITTRDWLTLRATLTTDEQARYRLLGQTVAQAIESTAQAIETGMTEFEIGAVLEHFLLDEGVRTHVLLIAADERIAQFRHPIPTGKTLENTVMLVAGGTWAGLGVSVTRMVSFAPLSDDLKRRHMACCYVDAVANLSTRPGTAASDIFTRIQSAYAEQGFPDEWQRHHQGGATGYAAREYKATMTADATVYPHQAFAWNPSITGTKVEDTVLTGATADDVPEFLSQATDDWPLLHIATPYGDASRPGILER